MKHKKNKNPKFQMPAGEWACALVLLCIPVIGYILAIVWAFSSTQNLDKRNFCRALIIFCIISVVIGLIYIEIHFSGLGELSGYNHLFGTTRAYFELHWQEYFEKWPFFYYRWLYIEAK